MPAMHFTVCQGFKYENGEIVITHGSDCRLVNHHRHGRFRWFMASLRCYCKCHEPIVIEESPDPPRVARHA